MRWKEFYLMHFLAVWNQPIKYGQKLYFWKYLLPCSRFKVQCHHSHYLFSIYTLLAVVGFSLGVRKKRIEWAWLCQEWCIVVKHYFCNFHGLRFKVILSLKSSKVMHTWPKMLSKIYSLTSIYIKPSHPLAPNPIKRIGVISCMQLGI